MDKFSKWPGTPGMTLEAWGGSLQSMGFQVEYGDTQFALEEEPVDETKMPPMVSSLAAEKEGVKLKIVESVDSEKKREQSYFLNGNPVNRKTFIEQALAVVSGK